MAEERARSARPGGPGAGAAGRRQARQHHDPVSVQGRDRRADDAAARHPRRAGRVHPRLWRRPRHVAGLQPAARRGFRQGRPARRAPAGAGGFPPHPRAVAALSPGAAHRRAGARGRARHGGGRVPAVVHAVQHRADGVRDRRRLRDPVAAVRLGLRPRYADDGGGLCDVHLRRHRLAHPLPARDEHAQQRSQHQGGRQPPQLRDRQVFRQRGARGGALRQRAARLRARRGQERDDAGDAQCRPGHDHRRGADRGDDSGGAGGRGGPHDGRRLRAGQHLSDPALHAAQLPRHGVSQHQAVADRSRADDVAAGDRAGDRGPSRRPGAGRRPRRARVPSCRFPLRPAPRDPAGRRFRGAARRHAGDRRPERRRQVDDRAPVVPLLRCQ